MWIAFCHLLIGRELAPFYAFFLAAAKPGWIIVGRGVVVVSPQTTRNGVVAIDPHTTRSEVAWDHSLAGMNDDMSRFGMKPSCGGIRRSTQSDQKA
jgi:hypothetical protein